MTGGEQLAFAQTISPPVLTSVHGTPSCANFPPKSPRPHPHSLQKGTCNRILFSALFIWEVSNNIATATKARPEDFTNGDTFNPRRFAFSRLFCFTELPTGSTKEAKRTDWINFLRAERCGPCDFGGICWNFLRGGKMLLNGARGLSEPQASCPECHFAFKHFFIPLEVPGFWNGTRNASLRSQNTFHQLICFRFLLISLSGRLVNKIAASTDYCTHCRSARSLPTR